MSMYLSGVLLRTVYVGIAIDETAFHNTSQLIVSLTITVSSPAVAAQVMLFNAVC